MIVVHVGVDEEGQCPGMTKVTPVSLHHTLRDLWEGLVTDGLITQVIPFCYRNLVKTSTVAMNSAYYIYRIFALS